MATFRLLNEFGISSVVFALEPARRCACHCSYCFAELNSRAQAKGRLRRDEDPGTFESIVGRAMGPDYDPSDFREWAVRNRLPVGFANTVEPFQDLPVARGILDVAAKVGMPLFVQTKGHNWAEAWPMLRRVPEVVLFASFPTDDDRAIRRFEIGCPPAAARYAMIAEAASAGIEVVLALAPYHEDWCGDPASHVRRAIEAGARHVFLDRLHLNRRQEEMATDPAMVGLAKAPMGEKYLDHLIAIHEAAADSGASFYYNGYLAMLTGFPNTTPSLCPPDFPAKGTRWGYHAKSLFHDLDEIALVDPEMAPFVVAWPEVVAAMERDGRGVDQPFSAASMNELKAVRDLPKAWRSAIGKSAPAREWLRAIWNSPSPRNVFWRHPRVRLALTPSGEPWRSDGGDVVMIYDPSADEPRNSLVVEDLTQLGRYAANGGS